MKADGRSENRGFFGRSEIIFLDSSKTTNPLTNSRTFYRIEKRLSERKLQPSKHLKQNAQLFRRLGKHNHIPLYTPLYLNRQSHVHLRAIATIRTATAYTPCLALYPCYHVSLPLFARGCLFYYQIWSVTDKQQTENQSL